MEKNTTQSEKELLFTYKGSSIYVKRSKNKFVIGISGNQIMIWFDTIPYDNLQLAITSGVNYARSVIDRMLLSKKRANTP